jgi:hypothetical protein
MAGRVSRDTAGLNEIDPLQGAPPLWAPLDLLAPYGQVVPRTDIGDVLVFDSGLHRKNAALCSIDSSANRTVDSTSSRFSPGMAIPDASAEPRPLEMNGLRRD